MRSGTKSGADSVVPSKTPEQRFWNKVDRTPGHGPNGDCWLWIAAIDSPGYGAIYWKGKKRNSHRVAYELTYGEIDRNLDICHSCDVRLCCNPAHLFSGTRLENVKDAVSKARHVHGENHGTAKLDACFVRLLRYTSKRLGDGPTALSKVTGVNKNTIKAVLSHQIWKHIQ